MVNERRFKLDFSNVDSRMLLYDMGVAFSQSNERYDCMEGSPQKLKCRIIGDFHGNIRRPSFSYVEELTNQKLITKEVARKAIDSFRGMDVSGLRTERLSDPERVLVKGNVHASQSVHTVYTTGFCWCEVGIVDQSCDCKGSGICSHVLALYLACSAVYEYETARPPWAIIPQYKKIDMMGPSYNARYCYDVLMRKLSMDVVNRDVWITVQTVDRLPIGDDRESTAASSLTEISMPSATTLGSSGSADQPVHSMNDSERPPPPRRSPLAKSAAAAKHAGPTKKNVGRPKKQPTAAARRGKKFHAVEKLPPVTTPTAPPMMPPSKKVDIVEILETKRVRKLSRKAI